MKGISMTSAPRSRRSVDNALAWWRARPTRTRRPERGRLPFSILVEFLAVIASSFSLRFRRHGCPCHTSRPLGNGDSLSVNILQNRGAAAPQKSFPNRLAQPRRVVAVKRFPQHRRSVRMGHNGTEIDAPVPHLGKSADGDLAAS